MDNNYNETLNLPVTDFPMRGGLPTREPAFVEKCENTHIYEKMQERNAKKPTFILHDGPPYANGDIHLGTALNKILKDIIVKYKSMNGYNAPYIPGWDCHGLPIELKALKQIGVENGAVDAVTLRKKCRSFALSCLDSQKKQFKRLEVLADYDNPYLTIAPDFEAAEVETFGKMYDKGYMYKGLKPVYWCADCNTALAEAEIEYEDDACYSVYVKFKIKSDKKLKNPLGIDLNNAYVVIWTTTTWTLPGNLAISVNPQYEYTFVKIKDAENTSCGQYLLMAKDLVEGVMAEIGVKDYETTGAYKGSELEFLETTHPFLNRLSPVIVGNHVTLESGTGCVHTAPGFGLEDFEVCNTYKGMFEIIVPVDSKGILTEEAGQFAGLTTDNANKAIAKVLTESGNMLATKKIVHSYPHCWRCHKPIIYRATKQWFCAVDKFADNAVAAIKGVNWIPEWGEERIQNMVQGRSDWCISRQRRWGVPIPALYCKDCGQPIVNDVTIKAIADLFRAESADAWYKKEPAEFIPKTVKCSCGCGDFTKETDIFDVWFDSGCSHVAVLENRLSSPADLYLEGCDQYRGWFQSSLLTSVACNNVAPYKAVCTHGWIVDGKGEKMSKSKGNYIIPEDVIKQYGADVLRLWVTSLDYHSDVRVSNEMLKQLSEVYRKIRNTARFMLGNLCNGKGFNPSTDIVPFSDLTELDKWAVYRYEALITKVKASYEAMDYYLAYHAINNFCVVDMSNFYLDIIKDRLYCEKEDGALRRAAQSTMYMILSGFARLIAPILTFTADEIWEAMPHLAGDNVESVLLNDMPAASGIEEAPAFAEKWKKIHAIRDVVLGALEEKRAEKVIGKSLEAKVILHTNDDLSDILPELSSAFIVSQVEVKHDSETLTIEIVGADGEKCERCWGYDVSVGNNEEHLCSRCLAEIKGNM